MYEAVTQGIRVRVTPHFVEEQSSPDESYYFWAYTVEITNEGEETVQLRTRAMADHRRQRPEGDGARPGRRRPDAACCSPATVLHLHLRLPALDAVGHHGRQLPDAARRTARMLDVAIPGFSLDSPFAKRSIN